MKTARMPVYYPVDHKANFSGYRTIVAGSDEDTTPWPAGRRIGVFVALALAGWTIMLAPFFLIG
jgi:hypothetical protein